MNALHDKTVDDSIFSSQSAVSVAAQRHPTSTFAVPTRRSMGKHQRDPKIGADVPRNGAI